MSAGSSRQGQEVSGSSSGFTEEEILTELHEMGYTLRPEQISELKKELDQLLAEDQATGNFDVPTRPTTVATDDPYLALQEAHRIHTQVQQTLMPQQPQIETRESIVELLEYAEKFNKRVAKELDKYDRDQRTSNGTTSGEEMKEMEIGNSPQTSTTERKATKELEKMLINEVGLSNGDKIEIPSSEYGQYLGATEKWVNNDKLIQPTIRPVVFAETGCPPFKHDPVKRYELYRKQWDKFPPPGDNKRLSLRWKVREYMLRQDIPVLAD